MSENSIPYIQALKQLIKEKMTPLQAILLCEVARMTKKTGAVFFTNKTLGFDMGLDAKAVSWHLRNLKKSGYILIEPRATLWGEKRHLILTQKAQAVFFQESPHKKENTETEKDNRNEVQSSTKRKSRSGKGKRLPEDINVDWWEDYKKKLDEEEE